MTSIEVFLSVLAAQCAVKGFEIAGRALRDWFFTTADEAFDRPIVLTPASDCRLCAKRPGNPGSFHGCALSGKPCAPTEKAEKT